MALRRIADVTRAKEGHPARGFPAAARHHDTPAGAAHLVSGVLCCCLCLICHCLLPSLGTALWN
jgi:hypothetical protein